MFGKRKESKEGTNPSYTKHFRGLRYWRYFTYFGFFVNPVEIRPLSWVWISAMGVILRGQGGYERDPSARVARSG